MLLYSILKLGNESLASGLKGKAKKARLGADECKKGMVGILKIAHVTDAAFSGNPNAFDTSVGHMFTTYQ